MKLKLSNTLPDKGLGEAGAFATLQPMISAYSADLGAVDVLAHMDPIPAGIAAQLVGVNAGLNQNLLHPDLSPFATHAEQTVIAWLAPFFGARAGHMCAGSTIANLAALWSAREHGATHVIGSSDAHISVPKTANILGLRYHAVSTDHCGRIDLDRLPSLKGAALVLTAGTTGRGVVDDLNAGIDAAYDGSAAWVHVDAAWAGPLRLTKFRARLDGIERAHSVAISAHKWLFQPKDSALVFFSDPAAQDAISFGGSYLATPNVGVQGSRSAAGVALLGTLLAWGLSGLAERLEAAMELSDALAKRIDSDARSELLQTPETAVLNWRPAQGSSGTEDILAKLRSTASRTIVNKELWVRQVAANMNADLESIWAKIDRALG